MNKKLSAVIKCIYFLLIAVFLAFALIGVYSYLSVYLTFGSVPSSEDFTAELIGNSGKEFKIVPRDIGYAAIYCYVIAFFLTLILVPLVLIWKYVERELNIHLPILFTLCFVFLSLVIVQGYTDAIGWYYGYILD